MKLALPTSEHGTRARPAASADFAATTWAVHSPDGLRSSAKERPMSRPTTLGALRESGWVSRGVKDELREHAIETLSAGEPLVEGVLGYDDTVLPQLANAILAGHDVIFLGERGQAKTRPIRGLVELLDEWMPVVAGSEINDD